MAERERVRVEARDFPGLMPQADPTDLPPGAAQVQVNVTSHVPGELRSRPGLALVTFEED